MALLVVCQAARQSDVNDLFRDGEDLFYAGRQDSSLLNHPAHHRMSQPQREVKVTPNIYQVFRGDGSHQGWRVYVKRDGVLKPKRFPPASTLEQLQAFIDGFKQETDRLRDAKRAADIEHKGSFASDAMRYLALKSVKAMPSYSDRERQIGKWVKAVGRRPRGTITTRDIDEQLQAWFDGGYSGSYVNKLRTALMALWTRLDGRAAANPVREAKEFPEADEKPRGQSYELLTRILDAIPDRARPVKGVEGVKPSPSRARLALMVWTGMTPKQIGMLTSEHFSIAEKWYTSPRRQKGKQPRFPRPIIRKPMTHEAQAAFRRFVEIKAFGPFDRRGLRHVWLRAVARVEKQMREELKDKTFALPRIRLYDIRHSFGTALFKETENLGLVGEMLDHANPRTTRRYALGAVPAVLQGAMAKFEKATRRPKTGNRFRQLPAPTTPDHTRRRTSTPVKSARRPSVRKRSKNVRK